MNIHERNEEIWRLRNKGSTYSQIARQFDLSSDRVRQVCTKKRARILHAGKCPPLRRELSMKVQNVLIKAFGSEDILGHPGKLASMGPDAFSKWRNMGRKSVNQLVEALESLGYSVNRHEDDRYEKPELSQSWGNDSS